MEMSSFSREMVFLILQFLDEEKYKETVHMLEQDSGFFFDMTHFGDAVINGEWNKAEKYLSGFTKADDNRYSTKIFFEIRKQKYLEALDRHERVEAAEILVNELREFSRINEDIFKELTYLLTLTDFRSNKQLENYGKAIDCRRTLLGELTKLIDQNPAFRGKLQFPVFTDSRLRTLIGQSFNWQQQGCKNPFSNPNTKTLFVDNNGGDPNAMRASLQSANPLLGPIPRIGGFPPLGAHSPFPPLPTLSALSGWMNNPHSVPQQTASAGPVGRSSGSNAASLPKRPRTPLMDYQLGGTEHVLKRTRPVSIPDEVNNNTPENVFPALNPSQIQASALFSADDFPKNLIAHLNQGSTIKSMDFHPVQQHLLLVGTNIGDIAIWEVASKERCVSRSFKVWDLAACSVTLQSSLATEYAASVNRVTWSPNGSLVGVAYSKHIVHLYSYRAVDDLQNLREFDAHAGNVNDLAFCQPTACNNVCIATCGEDKAVKVWDVVTGSKLHTFEGHKAPVYSLCTKHRNNIPFLFSTAIDGKIKAWMYDEAGCRLDCDAPGLSCTTMTYTVDETRLFSCGTNKEGESFLVEWNEIEGTIKRRYHGLGKRSVGVVQFDTTKSGLLAVGDEFLIKFWDMNNTSLLTSTDADGGLSASPCIRFNREGMLLAASTSDNGIKVLANADGVRRMQQIENRADGVRRMQQIENRILDHSQMASVSASKNGESKSLSDVKPSSDGRERCKIWKYREITEPSQLHSLRLPDHLLAVGITRLMYTNTGGALLALTGNAVHKLWKWQKNEHNAAGKATATMVPQLWQPSIGVVMTNEITGANLKEAVPCFSLSKNDAYVVSTSGGSISLFNVATFKTMARIVTPPPAATSVAFHPKDNNVLAVGMDDSTIHIIDIRVNEVKIRLKGHTKKVTGLAFSSVLNVLVSSGADSQLCVWSMDDWEKQTSKFLLIPTGRAPNPGSYTRVQFHQDKTHVMAVHESQIAVYEVPKLVGPKQWLPPGESSVLITDATYSCDSQSIYACFNNGNLAVLTVETLTLNCLINPAAFMPHNLSAGAFSVAIAAHPSESGQFAVGLTDGSVHVLELPETEGKWDVAQTKENCAGPSGSSASDASDQLIRR